MRVYVIRDFSSEPVRVLLEGMREQCFRGLAEFKTKLQQVLVTPRHPVKSP